MIIADLRGKLPELQNWEDYLTSCVFSSLKYLGSEYLGRFLKTAYSLDGKVLDISINNPKYEFWPRSNDGKTEPDLVISEKETIIVIEAKFYSGKSGIGMRIEEEEVSQEEQKRLRSILIDQLGREYYFRNKNGGNFVLYVTAGSVLPEDDILDTINTIEEMKGKKEAQNAKEHIFWTKWSQAAKIMEDIIENVNKTSYQYSIASDLLEFLDKRDLTDFKGFEFLSKYKDNFNAISAENLFYTIQPSKYWLWLNEYKSIQVKTNESIFYSIGGQYK